MTVTKNLNRANSSLKHSLVINNLIEYASRKKNKKKTKKTSKRTNKILSISFPVHFLWPPICIRCIWSLAHQSASFMDFRVHLTQGDSVIYLENDLDECIIARDERVNKYYMKQRRKVVIDLIQKKISNMKKKNYCWVHVANAKDFINLWILMRDF